MEREEEELLLVGVRGEALSILLPSSRSNLVSSLTLTLLLPLSFATLVLMPGPLLLYDSNQDIFSMGNFRVGNEALYRTRTSASMAFQWLLTTTRVLEFWILSTAVVMYTAASIYTLKEVLIVNVMTVVPMVWKRLALTLLWFFTIVLLHTTAYIMLFLLLMYTVGFDKYVNSREFLQETIPILAVFFCVLVYINMVGYLVSSISALQEQYYSLSAMRKRRRLVKGKQTTVLSFVMIYFICSQGSGLFWFAVAEWDFKRGGLVVAKAVYSTFLGGLLCLVMLCGLVTQTEV